MISVLYVDDEPGLLEIAKIFLEDTGDFRVATALSAANALNSGSIDTYDAIVSDYQMPGMDGIAFLKTVRERFGTIPFILFTGRGREEVVIDAINNGADFYLQKGGDPQAQFAELAHKIRHAVTAKRAVDALARSEESVRKKLEALISPSGDIGSLDLADIFDVAAVQTLMDDFYTLTHIGIGIIDLKGRVLVATGWQDICTQFHRKNPETCRNCTESDLHLAGKTGRGEFRMYKCRNNMWDIVTPIYLGELHIGNIFLGQFLFEDEQADTAIFRDQARRYGFDEKEYLAALARVPRWSREKVETAMRFYTRFAGMLSTLSYNNLRLGRLVADRDRLLESLRESESRHRDLVTTTADILWEADRNLSFTYVSPQVGKILGYRQEEMVGKRIFDFLDPGSSGPVHAIYADAASHPESMPLSYESFWRHRDGRRVFIETRALSVIGSGGTLAGFRGIDRDITTRRQAEDRISELIRGFLGFSSDPIANINILTGLAGQMLHGTCALYNRLEGGLLCSLGMWNVPPGYNACDQPEGHICTDIIHEGKDSPTVISDLSATRYAKTDPNVQQYNLVSYIGMPVQIGEKFLGSLCVVYQERYAPSRDDLAILPFLARAVAIEDKRRTAMLDLEESEEKFRSIFEMMRDGMYINGIRPDGTPGTFVSVNSVACTMVQYSREEMLGLGLADLITGSRSRSMPDILRELGAAGHAIFEADLRRKDGSVIAAEINANVVTLQGRKTMVSVVRDITERRKAEEELRESRRMLAEAMDLARLVNWEYDVNTDTFTFDNRFYALYGTSAEREGGTRMSSATYAREFVHPDDRWMVAAEIKKSLETTDPAHLAHAEHRIIRRDGEIRFISVSFAITKDQSGRTVRSHGANQDITERRRAEEALTLAQHKLHLLSGIARHDIGNQLATLNGFVAVLHRNVPDPGLDKYFTRIQEAAGQITAMIQFTKEYEQIGLHEPVWQNLAAVLDDSVTDLLRDGISLQNSIPPDIEVFADPLIARVFFNLMDNAIRHGERVTGVRVSSRRSGEGLAVIWEDNGIGIPAGEKEQIFERGFGKQTGLGMFLVREILSLTGITIAETGTPGEGARFEMLVPAGSYRVAGSQDPLGGKGART